MKKASHKSDQLDHARAKDLRHQSTPYEQKLWQELRVVTKQLGLKFRRQHPIHPYIPDFVCLSVKLIIELDGASHDNNQDYDQTRDIRLGQLGYKTLRFGNEEVGKNVKNVVAAILEAARTLSVNTENPSPAKTKDLLK